MYIIHTDTKIKNEIKRNFRKYMLTFHSTYLYRQCALITFYNQLPEHIPNNKGF